MLMFTGVPEENKEVSRGSGGSNSSQKFSKFLLDSKPD